MLRYDVYVKRNTMEIAQDDELELMKQKEFKSGKSLI